MSEPASEPTTTAHAHVHGETSEAFWEEMYRSKGDVGHRPPNPLLVEGVAGLSAGRALDLGCGWGGDAVWLASEGWRVTAVDVSPTALAHAAGHAAAAGVSDRITFQRHDLEATFPDGTFDLVCATFLHSPVALATRDDTLRSAAAAVLPGGTLLIVGHGSRASWQPPMPDVHLPTPEEVLADLALDAEEWDVQRAEALTQDVPSPEGEPGTRLDNILRVRRH